MKKGYLAHVFTKQSVTLPFLLSRCQNLDQNMNLQFDLILEKIFDKLYQLL